MPIIPHLQSITAIAEQSQTKEQFSYALRDFLDGFYAEPLASKLLEEPRNLAEILHDEGYADAYLAATAEHLARQYQFAIPSWCQNAQRILKNPNFAFKTSEGRMFLLVESPTAFRLRNIFVSANVLTRA